MASTIFVDGTTPIVASWLNDVNTLVYSGTFPSGTVFTGSAGNWSVGGNLSVTGTSLLTGLVTAPAGLTSSGNFTTTGSVVTGGLVVSGAGSIGTTLSVTGLLTATGGITTPANLTTTGTGALVVAGTGSIGTTFTIGSTLSVTGLSTFTGGFSSGFDSSVTGNFSVSGLSTLTGGITSPATIATTGSGTFSGPTVGVTTNSNAAAGQVGEYISAQVLSGVSISLTSTVNANITSISLTAGDWEIFGFVGFLPGSTTNETQYVGGISTTSATAPAEGNRFVQSMAATVITGQVTEYAVPPIRLSLATTTTVYLVARAIFTVSTMGSFGAIRARRMR